MSYKAFPKPINYFNIKNGLKRYFLEKNILYKIVDECWECISHKTNNSGYAVKHSGLIHREVYIVVNGEIPIDMLICHTCDNRKCINPNHLWAGTAIDNQKDKINKNRQAKLSGETNPMSKLTREQVDKIIQDNRFIKAIANDYNISFQMISRIKRKEAWL